MVACMDVQDSKRSEPPPSDGEHAWGEYQFFRVRCGVAASYINYLTDQLFYIGQ
jgi:hypothetical protein